MALLPPPPHVAHQQADTPNIEESAPASPLLARMPSRISTRDRFPAGEINGEVGAISPCRNPKMAAAFRRLEIAIPRKYAPSGLFAAESSQMATIQGSDMGTVKMLRDGAHQCGDGARTRWSKIMSHVKKSCASSASSSSRYLTEQEVADRLGLSVQFLRRRRERREAPRYAKFGQRVRYPVSEVEAFEEAALQPLLPPREEGRRRSRRA